MTKAKKEDADPFAEDNSFAGYGLDKSGRVSSIDPSLPPEERLKLVNRQIHAQQKSAGVPDPSDQEIFKAFNLSPQEFAKLPVETRLKLLNRLSASKAKA
ncbi:MAG: hypothetical protein ABL893_07980 [Hyphomicrobium sp.]